MIQATDAIEPAEGEEIPPEETPAPEDTGSSEG